MINEYAVFNKETKELMTPILCKNTLEDCRKFRNKLNNGMKAKTSIITFGWYVVEE